MTKKQKMFADEYLIDTNATRAYLKVYKNCKSEKTAAVCASRLLRNDNIKAYINEQLELIHSEKTADAQEVLEYLTAVMRGKQTEQTLQLIGDGIQKIANIDISARDRLKAAELIGKRYGMFTDKMELDGVTQVLIVDDLEE